ncbi:sulfite exporter TauE/SafE family protein [Calothrix sp. PCC 6303]|uniref:sulfite exporter TauE/SafE family protein n=1 Tax=Calothrix sp. PCC 6303 TaxID=1170562 RepID=UPI0002A045AC|nr:sulfite exporter TauE/SafE family protein [Calothrix sp. PCC 6303]AFZ01121.1 protein of unknown function DUF81 [Calothrix sp. PCC 6303]
MDSYSWLILGTGGLVSGVISGLLGIGGGIVTIPLMIALGYSPVQAIATSSLFIVMTSISGSIQNWLMGYLSFRKIMFLGIPAFITTGIGVYFASRIPPYVILAAFGVILVMNIYLIELRKQLVSHTEQTASLTPILNPVVASVGESSISIEPSFNSLISTISTGSIAGIMAGLFGLGGGTVMVPLQILLLGEPIKAAIQTSLGVIVITAFAASLGHSFEGNILFLPGLILGFGGVIGAQLSTRALPKLPEHIVRLTLRIFLGILAIYVFWESWVNFSNSNS